MTDNASTALVPLSSFEWWAYVVPWVSCILFSGAWIVLIGLCIRSISRFWEQRYTLFGATLVTRVFTFAASLLIVSLSSKTDPTVIIGGAVDLVRRVLLDIPFNTINVVTAPDGPVASGMISGAGQLTSMVVNKLFQDLTMAIASAEEGPPVVLRSLAYVLLLWFLLGQLFSPDPASKENSRSRIRVILDAIGPVRLQNLAFFLLLAIGLYFSIAAIAVIPELKSQTVAGVELSGERLRESLLEIESNSKLTALMGSTADAEQDPFTELRRYLQGSLATQAPQNGGVVAPATASAPGISEEARSILKNLLAEQEATRAGAISGYLRMETKARDVQRVLRQQALDNFTLQNHGRRGMRESADHFLATIQWYTRQLEVLEEHVRSCSPDFTQMDRGWAKWSSVVVSAFQGTNDFNALLQRGGFGGPNAYSNFSSPEDCFIQQRTILSMVSPPQRAPLGTSLGTIGGFVIWLLKPESLSLALIVGMLGFALLGSTVSTFVRERVERPGDTPTPGSGGAPLVKDLVGVLIRGISATVVVFLAVEGGLAIISPTPIEPNPYVLLLTCLVGAVYSEEVWKRARAKFQESAGGTDQSPEPPPGEQRPEAPGGTAAPGDGKPVESPPAPDLPAARSPAPEASPPPGRSPASLLPAGSPPADAPTAPSDPKKDG